MKIIPLITSENKFLIDCFNEIIQWRNQNKDFLNDEFLLNNLDDAILKTSQKIKTSIIINK